MEPDKIRNLVRNLDSSSFQLRLEIARRLEELGAGAVPYLIEGLRSDIGMVRQDCADLLGRLGVKEAIGSLEALLDDDQPGVRACATEAIRKIKNRPD